MQQSHAALNHCMSPTSRHMLPNARRPDGLKWLSYSIVNRIIPYCFTGVPKCILLILFTMIYCNKLEHAINIHMCTVEGRGEYCGFRRLGPGI